MPKSIDDRMRKIFQFNLPRFAEEEAAVKVWWPFFASKSRRAARSIQVLGCYSDWVYSFLMCYTARCSFIRQHKSKPFSVILYFYA